VSLNAKILCAGPTHFDQLSLNPARPKKPSPTNNSELWLLRWRWQVMRLWRLNVYGAFIATLLFDATILESFWCSAVQSYQKIEYKILSTRAGLALSGCNPCSCIGPRAMVFRKIVYFFPDTTWHVISQTIRCSKFPNSLPNLSQSAFSSDLAAASESLLMHSSAEAFINAKLKHPAWKTSLSSVRLGGNIGKRKTPYEMFCFHKSQ